jgi:hypothetical protein
MACVDHCHQTGIVRGAICHSCNKGIGILKDDPAILRRAIDHIETAARIHASADE